ncbi:MAG: N-acetyl-gamma-glutamyl-phosphate reductase [Alphaproteobacteria bacterium]|nr:N-acetyl-gamma-glutamyl-phosphate reductase [Alphaproteobacteria bacterium]MBT5861205.1 N-acetyl-gamma-glutamyl-phosphate reductase [Alphaproteobacteria bacterium]
MAETNSNKIRAAILGASGYVGAELVRLLSRHSNVEIVVLTAERRAGQPLAAVYPHLGDLGLPDLLKIDQVEWGGLDVDVVFCALPHGTTQPVVAGLLHATHHSVVDELVAETTEDVIAALPKSVKVVDLSADFRLRDVDVYRQWYGHAHQAADLQKTAVYGLTEFSRDAIAKASLIACPGCYPTTTLLPLVPLLEKALILPYDIIVDAKSGVSGAGRSEKEANLYAEVAEGMHAYGLGGHRHAPEIDQELSVAANEPVTVSFTPHLAPMSRGILATTYVKLADGATAQDLHRALVDRFEDESFIRVLEDGAVPATRHVRGSNFCQMNVFPDRVSGRAILVSATDNLIKGASGQAIQNMNVAFGFAETTGLEAGPLFP